MLHVVVSLGVPTFLPAPMGNECGDRDACVGLTETATLICGTWIPVQWSGVRHVPSGVYVQRGGCGV